MTDSTSYISRAAPHWILRVLGVVVLLVMLLALYALVVLDEDAPLGFRLLLGVAEFFAAVAGLCLAVTPVVTTVDESAVGVRYWPYRFRIPLEQITEVRAGDHVRGVGFGYGVRFEGKGKRAVRVGGPVVTVVHERGRLAFSVDDADRLATQVRARMAVR